MCRIDCFNAARLVLKLCKLATLNLLFCTLYSVVKIRYKIRYFADCQKLRLPLPKLLLGGSVVRALAHDGKVASPGLSATK